MRNRLLVVDGEPTSLRVLDVSLRGAGFDVDTATDGLQAWALLQDATPDLLLCDADLGGMDGFELCARLRRTPAGAELPVLLVSASRSREQKIRALEAGADDFLVKPTYIKEVLTRVRALLQRRDRDALTADDGAVTVAAAKTLGRAQPPFAGDLADITVVDLVQLIEGNGRSGIVQLRGTSGRPAFLYFREGKVVDAEAGRLSGLDALSRLFSWTAGTFEIEWKNIRRKDAIARPSSALVLEGMQRLDAWNELREQVGDPNAVLEVDYRLLAERLAEIPDELNGVLRLCDGVRTVMQVVEDSPMPDTEALTALLRLRAEGIVQDKATSATAEAPDASARFDGRPALASSPFPLVAPGPNRRSATGSGPVEQSFAARLEVDAPRPAPTPDAPRRTAPGLGHPAPLGEDEYPQEIPAAPDRGHFEQDNVIQFPAPPVPFPPHVEVAPSANPTLIGFEPATAIPEPPAERAAPHSPSATAAATPASLAFDPSMTLPLGLAQEAAMMRDQVARDPAGAEGDDEANSAPATEAPTIPSGPASMRDTHRGFGPLSMHRESPSMAAVPVEIPESSSGAARRSYPVSAPTAADAAAGDSGRTRPGAAEQGVPNGAVVGETSGRRSAARKASANETVPRPGDATVKVTFSDGDISRRDALDELGLPSRWRGFRVLIGALVIGSLAAVGVSRVLNRRGHGEGADVATQTPTHKPAPGSAAEGAPPAAPSAIVAAVTPPSTGPAVELPTANAAPPAPEATGPAADGGDRGRENARQAAAPSSAPEPAPLTGKAGPAPAEPASAPAAPAGEEAVAAAAARTVVAKTGPPGAAVPAKAGAPVVEPLPPRAAEPESATAPPVAPGVRELADCRKAFAKNRLREALAACTAATAANPRSAEALAMLAHTELNRGRLARANELAEKAVAIDPRLADAYVIIGGVNQDSGQNREAKAAYRRYLELAPRGRYADELRSIVNGL